MRVSVSTLWSDARSFASAAARGSSARYPKYQSHSGRSDSGAVGSPSARITSLRARACSDHRLPTAHETAASSASTATPAKIQVSTPNPRVPACPSPEFPKRNPKSRVTKTPLTATSSCAFISAELYQSRVLAYISRRYSTFTVGGSPAPELAALKSLRIVNNLDLVILMASLLLGGQRDSLRGIDRLAVGIRRSQMMMPLVLAPEAA